MRKLILGMIIVFLLVAAIGCAPKKEAAPVPVAPPAPEPIEVTPPVEEAKEVEQKTILGDLLEKTESDIQLVTDLKCDVIEKDGVQEGRFEFTLTNPTSDSTWYLRRVSALESGPEVNPLVITVNGRRFEHTDCDGESGTETLGPGESVVCARGFEPKSAGSSTTDWVIRVGVDDLGSPLKNRMVLKGLKVAAELTFKCG